MLILLLTMKKYDINCTSLMQILLQMGLFLQSVSFPNFLKVLLLPACQQSSQNFPIIHFLLFCSLMPKFCINLLWLHFDKKMDIVTDFKLLQLKIVMLVFWFALFDVVWVIRVIWYYFYYCQLRHNQLFFPILRQCWSSSTSSFSMAFLTTSQVITHPSAPKFLPSRYPKHSPKEVSIKISKYLTPKFHDIFLQGLLCDLSKKSSSIIMDLQGIILGTKCSRALRLVFQVSGLKEAFSWGLYQRTVTEFRSCQGDWRRRLEQQFGSF